ncbi:MAG: uracil-DNA glycosylase [Pseudomonadota bacterium]
MDAHVPRYPRDWYDIECRVCPRLSAFLDEVKDEKPEYFCRPVPPFGDPQARLLIVGLAPGKHGANATGRPFTGDFSGKLLFQTLYKFGYASASESIATDDGLMLHDCRISNAVKCLPPQNKPVGSEENNCNHFIAAELAEPGLKVILTLGMLAHRAVIRSKGEKQSRYKFAHNTVHTLEDGAVMVNSYHCSRYNIQTRRLTRTMFHQVFETVALELEGAA